MMMAFDSSPTPPSRLDDATVAAVRQALRHYLANDSEADGLREALQRMSAEAHGKGVRAEQLLVLLKDAWSTIPEVRAMTDARAQSHRLQHVVTMCIKEYYSS
jgi:hypothetical protein